MRSLSIKAKMLAVFALITLALALVAVIAIRGVSLLNDDLSELYQERLVPVSQLARINAQARRMSRNTSSVLKPI